MARTYRVSALSRPPRRVAKCSGHILDELVPDLLARTGIAAAVRDRIAVLIANARRANPKRDRKAGGLRAGLRVVGVRRYVITYEGPLAAPRYLWTCIITGRFAAS